MGLKLAIDEAKPARVEVWRGPRPGLDHQQSLVSPQLRLYEY